MADKRKGKKGFDDDFDDFDDLDLGFDFDDDMDDDDKPTKKLMASTAKKAAKDALVEFGRTMSAKGLPEEYEYGINEIKDYLNIFKETIEESTEEINKSTFALSKRVQKTLPFQSKMLNKYIESQEWKFDKSQSTSNDQMRNNEIESTINAIFQQKASEENRQQSAKQLAATKIQSDVLLNISNTLSQTNAFHNGIGRSFFQESLRLQFRSYHVQADMLKLSVEYNQTFAKQLDGILKNTALPDMVKITDKHISDKSLRERRAMLRKEAVYTNQGFKKNLREGISSFAKDKVGQLTEALGLGTDFLDDMGNTGVSRWELLATIAGSNIGGAIGDKFAPKLRKRLEKNDRVKAGGRYMNMLATNPAYLFSTMRDRLSGMSDSVDESGVGGRFLKRIMEGGSDLLGSFSDKRMDTKISNTSNILSANKPAIFDNKTHRSITEVIPMYLAKILQSNTSLKEMYRIVNLNRVGDYKDPEELLYSYNDRKLSTLGNIQSKLGRQLFKDDLRSRVSGIGTDILRRNVSATKKDPDKLTKQERSILLGTGNEAILKEYLEKASSLKGVNLDFETLIDNWGSKDASPELTNLVRGNRKLVNLLSAMSSATSSEDRRSFDRRMSNVDTNYPTDTVIEFLKSMAELAGNDQKPEVSTKVAIAFSQIMTDYIMSTGGDITPKLVMDRGYIVRDQNGKSNISQEQLDIVQDTLISLGRHTAAVWNKEDRTATSLMELAYSQVSKALKTRIESTASVFKQIHEYDRRLTGEGVMNHSNIIEGNLKIDGNRSSLSIQELRQSITATNYKGTDFSTTAMGKAFANIVGEAADLKEEFSSASFMDKLSIISREATKYSSMIADRSKALYAKTSDSIMANLDDVDSYLKELKDKVDKRFLKVMEANLTSAENKLSEYRTTFTSNREREIEALRKAADEVKNTSSESGAMGTLTNLNLQIKELLLDKEVELRVLDGSIAAIRSARNRISSAASALDDINPDTAAVLQTVKDLLSELKQVISRNSGG